MDTTAFAQKVISSIPFVGLVDITVESAGPEQAVATMPWRTPIGNHVGTPHAGAMFTLAESCSGALACGLLAEQIAGGLLVVVKESTIRYRRPVVGDARAVATLLTPAAEVIAAVNDEGRADFVVSVQILGTNGGDGATAEFTWAARAPR
jgi:uncharacterized protein (TIGR00369 family)